MKWWPFRRTAVQRAISYQDVWGSGGDPAVLRGSSQERALRLGPVYAATRLLADSVASLPLKTYRVDGENRLRAPVPDLFRKPAAVGGRYDWLHRCMTSLTLRGNAYGLVVAWGPDGWPSQIEWLHPDDVFVEDNLAPTPVWFYKGRRLEDGQMFHIPAFTVPGQILGLSPIAYFATTTEAGLLANQFGRDWFANGSTPSARAATIYSKLRPRRNSARTTPTSDTQLNSSSIPSRTQKLGQMRSGPGPMGPAGPPRNRVTMIADMVIVFMNSAR